VNCLDFGLISGIWLGKPAAVVVLMIAVLENFKRLGIRSEEATQAAETKPTTTIKGGTAADDEEAKTIALLAAVQACLNQGGESFMKQKFKITVGGKSYEVEVEDITPPEPAPVPPPYIGPPRVLTEPPRRTIVPRPIIPMPRRVETPRGATQPQPQPTTIQTPEVAKPVVSGEVIKAPLPGVVVAIKVKEGDQVKQGDALLILESMKMENAITAPRSGVVKRILTKLRASVQHGEPLIELE